MKDIWDWWIFLLLEPLRWWFREPTEEDIKDASEER